MSPEHFEKLIESKSSELKKDSFFPTLKEFFENLGHPDEEIRVKSYKTLGDYFLGKFCPLKWHFPLLEMLLSDDFLFFNIESDEDKFAIKRSYSALMFPCVVGMHTVLNRESGNYFDKNTVDRIAKSMVRYILEEKNTTNKSENMVQLIAWGTPGIC